VGGSAGFEKTGKTGCYAGTNSHGQPITGDGSGVDPRPAGFDGNIVDQETSFEIVSAVQEQIDAIEKCFRVAGAEIGHDPFDGHGRIDGAKLTLRGDGLWEDVESVGFIEERLPLQVGGLNEIAIDDPEVADAGANEEIGCGSADGTAADNGRS